VGLLLDEIVAALDADFWNGGARATKAAVKSSAVQSDNMPAANINPEYSRSARSIRYLRGSK